MGKHTFLKAVTAVAAIGGACYIFKDKIKESSIYQSMDVDDKVQKVKTTIKEKMPQKSEEDKDYFTLDDDDINVSDATCDTDDEIKTQDEAPVKEEAASEEPASEEAVSDTAASSVQDVSAMVDDLISDIPTVNFENKASTESSMMYENEGLSDTDEDIDVLEEQDKLDI